MDMRKSEMLYDNACKVIPGGVNSPVRAFKSVGMKPVFIDKAEGSYIYDVDGNRYLDFIGSWGPSILGHSNPVLYSGIQKQLEKGTSFGLPTELEVEIAGEIVEAIDSIEMVRLVNSGTEATMSALRLAKGVTNRPYIVKFEGCYHGHGDSLLVKAGSGALTFGQPTSAGVFEDITRTTLIAQVNQWESVLRLFESYKGKIAAVIVEPVPANMGVVPFENDFLAKLRELTLKEGSLLIFDEVITGFRMNYKGAGHVYGIDADITCLGKIIGGGLPIGAFGGKRKFMEMIAPVGPVYQAGTLSGNPIAVRIGLNTLRYLKEHPEVYEQLEWKAKYLEEGINRNLKEANYEGCVRREGSLISFFFAPGPIKTFEDVMKSDTDKYAQYFQFMVGEGVMLPPSQYEALFLSDAHTQSDLDEFLEKQRSFFSR